MKLVPALEAELAEPVLAHFSRQGYEVAAEVPFNGRIADVLATKGGEVHAVELKLRDWRTALRQAVAYQVGCHATHVGMPLSVVEFYRRKAGFERAFREPGVGLLAVNHPYGDVRVVWEARESARRLDFLADHLARGVSRSLDL